MKSIFLLCLISLCSFDDNQGNWRYIYSNQEKCDYCANTANNNTWVVRAYPAGEPICHQRSGNLTVYTLNHTWANITFASNRLVIYDYMGCVEYFSDNSCKHLSGQNCLDNSTRGPANVTLFGHTHYKNSCYCFAYSYYGHTGGPCTCNDILY